MPWPSYKNFYIPYQDTPKNISPVYVGHHTNMWLTTPDFTSGSLFDGHIIIATNAARPHLALREILQDTLNTPAGTTQALPRYD